MQHVVELSDEELGIQRFILDLALQPLGAFEGFDHIEQLGGSAYRYQLNSISYALALAQYNRTPAFTGYLAEAQRNAILKMCDRRVWSYWAYENLIGYGKWDPDPIIWNNVMYTAYFGVMIGLYETLNDDRSLSQPGSLKLVWNESISFDYDFARIAEAIRRNMLARPDCPQYPCEPHLIYPMCNTFAFNTLLMHDRLHGTELTGNLVERVRESYDRDGWRKSNGRFVAGRIEKLRMPILPTSIAHDAVMAFWLNAAMPDLAGSTWEMICRRFIDQTPGNIQLKGQWWDRLDFGNYNFARGDTFTRAMLSHTAREMGDEEVAQALDQSLEGTRKITWQHGARRFSGVSVMCNGIYAMARYGRQNGMRDLILGRVPEAWRKGPILGRAAYPEVLVARAVTDGEALDLVLKPGRGKVSTRLGLERLVPGRNYRLTGDQAGTFTAGADGCATVEVALDRRTELRILPVV